jgi:signal transduction histidine kinase
MLTIIKDGVDYSNQIINDLLDFSRDLRLELSESTPRTVIRETINHVVLPANIQVSDLTEESPIINIDEGKMERALRHIVENAVQAMPDGGELKISSKRLDDEIEIVITDTGIGMTKEVLREIFTPLFTTKAKGIGLGLAISRRIVEAHGGSITVQSKTGEGSCFRVKIPIGTNRKGIGIHG